MTPIKNPVYTNICRHCKVEPPSWDIEHHGHSNWKIVIQLLIGFFMILIALVMLGTIIMTFEEIQSTKRLNYYILLVLASLYGAFEIFNLSPIQKQIIKCNHCQKTSKAILHEKEELKSEGVNAETHPQKKKTKKIIRIIFAIAVVIYLIATFLNK